MLESPRGQCRVPFVHAGEHETAEAPPRPAALACKCEGRADTEDEGDDAAYLVCVHGSPRMTAAGPRRFPFFCRLRPPATRRAVPGAGRPGWSDAKERTR